MSWQNVTRLKHFAVVTMTNEEMLFMFQAQSENAQDIADTMYQMFTEIVRLNGEISQLQIDRNQSDDKEEGENDSPK